MISQEQALQNSGIPTDDIPNIQFTNTELAFIESIEGIVWDEYDEICKKLGTSALEELPANYEDLARIEARWMLKTEGILDFKK